MPEKEKKPVDEASEYAEKGVNISMIVGLVILLLLFLFVVFWLPNMGNRPDAEPNNEEPEIDGPAAVPGGIDSTPQ